jgi:hypothetical protein
LRNFHKEYQRFYSSSVVAEEGLYGQEVWHGMEKQRMDYCDRKIRLNNTTRFHCHWDKGFK